MAKPNTIQKNSPLLITGAFGFVGKNLTAQLQAEGYENLLLYDVASPAGTLASYARQAEFVFHFAGVNRPQNPADFYTGNTGLTEELLGLLRAAGNKAPVLLTSSAQAGNGTDYGSSKQAAEDAVFAHAAAGQSPVFVYRMPGLFGKWCRPAYNSVVATFCHNVARGLPIEVRDEGFTFPLCYIDDAISCFTAALLGRQEAPAPGAFCEIAPVYSVSLGRLAALLQSFKESRATLQLPDMGDEFCQKLFATYLSYLPENEFAYPLQSNTDERGSFTEFLRTPERGQVSINVAKPGIVKGNHWHNTKNEKFLVVKGEAVIRFRRVGTEQIFEYPVNGETLTVVDIPTGYTHNIENVGTGDLVTVMWASEPFNPARPDTYFEKV
ncbi:MAG: NAD-dependent epimerase/dehydratase family protein [Oscillospiraceae bacterium]